jgi:hypothetical protein
LVEYYWVVLRTARTPNTEGAKASVVAAVKRVMVAMESFVILPDIVVLVVAVVVVPNFSFELLFMGRRDLFVSFSKEIGGQNERT